MTHDRSGTDRTRLDSVAERIIQRLPVPVLTAKSGWTPIVPAKEAGVEAPD